MRELNCNKCDLNIRSSLVSIAWNKSLYNYEAVQVREFNKIFQKQDAVFKGSDSIDSYFDALSAH